MTPSQKVTYNVFVVFEQYDSKSYYLANNDEFEELKEFVRTIMGALGIENKVKVYLETTED